MGLIRLFLAISVAYGHTEYIQVPGNPFNYFFINASAAVICFFTISGFYMAFIINEKYKLVDHWQKKFIINRCLRLYPTYLLFLALSLAFYIYLGMPNFLTGLGINAAENAWIGFMNLSLIGQDIYAMAVQLRGGDLLTVFPVAQAWSIAVEFELYLIAAFLFSSRKGLLTALGVGVVLRLLMQKLGLIVSPIGHMLVFNVIVFFALGGCVYLLYKKIESMPVMTRRVIAGILLTLIFAYSGIHYGFWDIDARGDDFRCIPLYIALALATPFVFSLSKGSKLDNLLGNLSYPVYLGHIFVFNLVRMIRPYTPLRYFLETAIYVDIAVVLVLSYLAVKFVEEPINNLRAKLIRTNE